MSSSRSSCLLAPLLALASTAALHAGCSVYDPKLLETDANDPPDTATPIDARGPTASRQPPTRPSAPDDGVGIAQLTFALRNSLLDQGSGWTQIGYDLDGVTTNATTSFATQCLPPSSARPPSDGADGIDNVFGGRFFPLVNAVIPGLQDTARLAQEQGIGMPVIRVIDWNGTPNDSRVDCVMTTAVFSTSADGEGTAPPEVNIVSPRSILLPSGDQAPYPVWDGLDWVWARSDTFVGVLERPLIRDDNAYVANGQVVVRLPAGIQLVFPAAEVGILVRLSEAIIVGTLTPSRELTDVTVTGRWSIVDLLSTAEAIGICAGTMQYTLLESQLNEFADIRRTPPAAGEMNLTCDALSVAVIFRGSPIRIAGLATGLTVMSRCALMGDAGVADAGPRDAGIDAFATPPTDAFVAPGARPMPDAFGADAFSPDAT